MNGPLGSIQRFTGDQIRDRVQLMFGQVWKSIRWPMTRTLAAQMVLQAGCPSQQLVDVPRVEIDKCQIAAVFWYFKEHAYYMGDVANLDTYQTARRTYELGMVPSPLLAAAIPAFRGQMRSWMQLDLNAYMNAMPVMDCDDGVITLCSLLASIGFRVGAKTISDDGNTFGHTYAVVEIPRYVAGPKSIVALDATEFESYPGWEPPARYRVMEKIFWYGEAS